MHVCVVVCHTNAAVITKVSGIFGVGYGAMWCATGMLMMFTPFPEPENFASVAALTFPFSTLGTFFVHYSTAR